MLACYTPPIKVDGFLLINSFLPAWAAAEGTEAGRAIVHFWPDTGSTDQESLRIFGCCAAFAGPIRYPLTPGGLDR